MGKKAKKANKAAAKSVRKSVKARVRTNAANGNSRGPVDDGTLRIISSYKKLSKEFQAEVLQYALCLHDPEHMCCRFPDVYPRTSALYKSVQEFDVPISFGGVPGSEGRFAIVSRPIIGDPTVFNDYRSYVPNSNASGWSTGIFLTSDFATNLSSVDPRVDPERNILVGTPPSGTYVLTGGTTAATGVNSDPFLLFSGTVQVNTADITVTAPSSFTNLITFPALGYAQNYRISMFNSLIRPDNTMPYAPNSVLRTTVLTPSAGVTISGDQLYMIRNLFTLDTVMPPSAVPNSSGLQHTPILAGYISLTVPSTGGSLTISSPPPTATEGMWADGATVLFHAGAAKSIRVVITSDPVDPTQPTEASLVKTIRPVGYSVLLKWVGPLIENAGKLSAALAPQGTFSDGIFANETQNFNPFFYETYQRLNTGNDMANVMHTSRLDHGCYVSFRPQSVDHTRMLPIADSNNLDWPVLCIAGQYAKASAPISATDGVFLRARISGCFEYTTNSRIPESGRLPLSYEGVLSAAFNIHRQLLIPEVMENDIHDWYRTVMESVQEFGRDLGTLVGGTAGAAVGSFIQQAGVAPSVGVGPSGASLSFAKVK